MKTRAKSIITIEGLIPKPLGYPEWFIEMKKDRLSKNKCLWCGKNLKNNKLQICYASSCVILWILHTNDTKIRLTALQRYVHKYFNFKCSGCNIKIATVAPSGIYIPKFMGHVDHIIAICLGGADHWDNLQLLCQRCHKVKTKKDLSLLVELRKRDMVS